MVVTAAMQGTAPVDFQRDVQPILAANCLTCHGRHAEARQADLRLDHHEGAIAPRRRGAAVVPGDPDASRLLIRVGMDHADDRMPPEGRAALSDEDIDVLHRWIQQGAPWEGHWAWKPLSDTVHNSSPVDPIDTFIAERLNDAGLHRSPAANGETWLRRVSFDLTGLPPTPEALKAINVQDTPQGRADLVDTYLASPAFGEHWARHWLDALSYAETCGHEFDYPLPGAWRFRDWLVDALNNDLTWGRIVQELIAGDLIDPRIDPATGLNVAPLGTGMWRMHQAVHAPVDVLRDEDDHRSDQLDALGRGLLGVTISCARCHDHKFDPISARDYQSLANMLRSSRVSSAGMDQNAAVLADIQALRRARQATGIDVHALEAWIIAAGLMGAGLPRDNDAPLVLPPPTAPVLDDFESGTNWTFDGHAFAHAPAGTWFPAANGPALTLRGMLHSGLLGQGLSGTARSHEFTLDADTVHWRVRGKGTLRVIVDDYVMDEANALLFESHLQQIDSDDWTTITHDVAKYRGHRAFLEATDVGEGTLEVDAVAMASQAPWPQPHHDRRARGTPLRNWRMSTVADASLRSAVNAMHEQAVAVPAMVPVLSMRDASPVEQPVYLRGDPALLGEAAPRRVPDLLGGGPAVDTGSGRHQLAMAVTSPDQPQLWRTAANRIWHHLLGAGLTQHLDDLGAMGTPPSHPLLLDHLAASLADGTTIKALIRRIVLTSTYGQSSMAQPAAIKVDPGNVLLHCAHVRRLTGEQIRDAILAASGQLNRIIGGKPVPLHLTEAMTGRGRPAESGPRDGDGRRSLYLEVRRNFAVPLLEAFDRPTPNRPCGRRSVSNVPAQALSLMNDPFVLEQAAHLATAVRTVHGDTDAALQEMARRTWSRSLTDAELARLQTETETNEGWVDIAHAMLCAKAFIFVQ
jgi:cytochrome c553